MDANITILTSDRAPVSFFLVVLLVLPLTSACQDSGVIRSAGEDTATTIPAVESNDSVVDKASKSVNEASEASTPYTIECKQDEATGRSSCMVDKGTFIGWRTYHGFCHVCHAQDAVGSTFAPSLVDRMQTIDYETFVDRTGNGYTGQVGVMPPWKDNPNVRKRYKELFAYLKARSDGVLVRGRPARLPN